MYAAFFFPTLGVFPTSSSSPESRLPSICIFAAQCWFSAGSGWSNFVSGVEAWSHFNCFPRDTAMDGGMVL